MILSFSSCLYLDHRETNISILHLCVERLLCSPFDLDRREADVMVLHLCVEGLLCSPFDLDRREADVIILHLRVERLLCSPLGAVIFAFGSDCADAGCGCKNNRQAKELLGTRLRMAILT